MTSVRLATPDDADAIAQRLHDFNVEFETPTPDVSILAERLRHLLTTDHTLALVAGDTATGVALVTLRPNVWYDGQVALLDELYVVPRLRNQGIGSDIMDELNAQASHHGWSLIEINVYEGNVDAQRFYARHGFCATEPDSDERALYYFQEL